MGEQTNIPWCDSTISWWEGCTKVSPGCANCYAEARDQRMMIEPVIHWGKSAPRRKSKSAVKQAFSLNRNWWICEKCGESRNCSICQKCGAGFEAAHRRRIFSLSLGDIFDPEVPVEMLAEALDTIRQCDKVDWLLLTKRLELWQKRKSELFFHIQQTRRPDDRAFGNWLHAWHDDTPPENIWIGATAENQETADKRIPELLKIPAKVRFLSCEPLLGPIDFRLPTIPENMDWAIDWVIVGGESGPNARPCNVQWIRDIKDQCKAANVPCFVKQLGADSVGWLNDSLGECDACCNEHHPSKSATKYHGWDCYRRLIKHPKGGDPSEWPKDLRIREFP